jgi:hypothetical protein
MESIQARFMRRLEEVVTSKGMHCSVHYAFANMGTVYIHRDESTCDVLEHVRFEFSAGGAAFTLGRAKYEIAYISGPNTIPAGNFWHALALRLDQLRK